MSKDKLREQCEELIIKYTELEIEQVDELFIIDGEITFFAEYENLPIIDSYQIRIEVPLAFPQKIPTVYEIGGKIEKKFQHFLTDGSLCLGVHTEMKEKLKNDSSVLEFVDSFVISYLYTHSYYLKYGQMPFGERSHGLEGIYEFYKEKLLVKTSSDVIKMLGFICFKDYRGHLNCPCGSKMKMRKCIHKDIILEMKHNGFMDDYLGDLYNMIQYEKKKKEYQSSNIISEGRRKF